MSVDTITSMHPSVVEERWRDNYSKLHLFSLQEYDVVMFIDADAVVLGDLQAAAPSSRHLLPSASPAPLAIPPPPSFNHPIVTISR